MTTITSHTYAHSEPVISNVRSPPARLPAIVRLQAMSSNSLSKMVSLFRANESAIADVEFALIDADS